MKVYFYYEYNGDYYTLTTLNGIYASKALADAPIKDKDFDTIQKLEIQE